MKNIELKVNIKNDKKKLQKKLKFIHAIHKGIINQQDIYFNCLSGRLKLRNNNNKKYELIFYLRPNKKISKTSNYQIIELSKKSINSIKNILGIVCGFKNTVKKTRDLWFLKNTRIHLDKVFGIGNFLELETLVKRNLKAAKKEHGNIIKILDLERYKKYSGSYSDMLN
ncbi:MAG TPA: class IV adenylate cyclase [Candidatus Paceibacterota bacterium]|nr:class IV adenylate cyclase [Candidatus Paceibacterota bacterium]